MTFDPYGVNAGEDFRDETEFINPLPGQVYICQSCSEPCRLESRIGFYGEYAITACCKTENYEEMSEEEWEEMRCT